MSHHQFDGDHGMLAKFGADGGMTVKFKVGLERLGHFRSHGGCIAFGAIRFCLVAARGIFGVDETLVERRFAIVAHFT